MTKQKNISHDAMREHLMELAERLLDPEIVKDKESANIEIEKARAMIDIAKEMTEMDKQETADKSLSLEAMRIAGEYGFHLKDVNNVDIKRISEQ